MFIGREKELDFLNNRYESGKAEFIVLYGRRRVGKTETLNEFCRGKKHIFYSCREYTDEQQLTEFSRMILSDGRNSYIDRFRDWDTAFSYLGELSSDEKIIIVIDEFPYMCKNNASIPSVLQIIWDTILKDKNIMLILCGSSMSFIEKELLSEKNPLYGRTTGIYKMLPMPYYDAEKFFPNYSDEDKLTAYSILGGIPHYLNQFDPNKTLKDNIIENILTKGTVLYSEVEFLLRQELREISVYNTVIEAIALGNTTFNDIFLKTQIDKTKISVYLKNLAELEIIRREFPALSGVKENSGSAKGQYYLTDNLFRFWFAYGYSNLSYLERGDAEGVWEDYISNDLHHFASKSFEEVCISYLYEMNKKKELPFRIANIGRWWGNITKNFDGRKQSVAAEIDILASDRQEKNYIVGECKFTNSPFDMSQFNALMNKLSLNGNVYYYLFSLSGFAESVRELADKENNIVLVSAARIMSLS